MMSHNIRDRACIEVSIFGRLINNQYDLACAMPNGFHDRRFGDDERTVALSDDCRNNCLCDVDLVRTARSNGYRIAMDADRLGSCCVFTPEDADMPSPFPLTPKVVIEVHRVGETRCR